MDFVQWTGPSPAQDPANWEKITYKYDQSGRRIEKTVDGYSTRYLYDGGNVIAEYDGNNNLLRKYIHGPRVDEPVCMIDVADSNAVYYYHFDGLGSVVALSDSNGDSCQTYEYSVYGQVAAEDPNFLANPYMFTGRRFDIETGLYYYRARYYNPYIGRFLQTDPVGYGAGMNLYAYCGNNPLAFVDSFGLYPLYLYPSPADPCFTLTTGRIMILPYRIDPTELSLCEDLADWLAIYKAIMSWTGRIGTAINLIERKYGKIITDYFDPASNLVGAYIDAMEAVCKNLPDIIGTDKNKWKAFIEIQPWRWKRDEETGEFVVTENGSLIPEKFGDPSWIEVVGLAGYQDSGSLSGYVSGEEAYAAALKGIYFWRLHMLGYKVPTDWWSDFYSIYSNLEMYSGSYTWKGDDIPEFGP